jgi:DNA mismatch endonuclease, patch repair protein
MGMDSQESGVFRTGWCSWQAPAASDAQAPRPAGRLAPVSQVLAQTSLRMKRVRRADTAPELVVRRFLRELGASYRTCVRGLPGTPDIANRRRGWAIFVHGCFWHGHRGCKLSRLPRTNTAFWRRKLAGNRARDARKEAELLAAGLRVLVVWQCEIRHRDELAFRLRRLAKGSASRDARGRRR